MTILEAKSNWLSDMDSNHDKGLQRALCYHYTIGQPEGKLARAQTDDKHNDRGRWLVTYRIPRG